MTTTEQTPATVEQPESVVARKMRGLRGTLARYFDGLDLHEQGGHAQRRPGGGC
jgi:hypothetical protein